VHAGSKSYIDLTLAVHSFPFNIQYFVLSLLNSLILNISYIMPLCTVCDALELGPTSRRDGTEPRLGEYDEMRSRAENGCEGCKFFCDILQSSNSWRERVSELSGKIIFLSSQRLDVRKPDRLDRSTYSCDDLLFDYTVSEDYTGM
jgi:hypothetical protein